MKNISSKLFWHSQYLGFRSLIRGYINSESIKRIICPMDISRYYELPVVLRNLKLKNSTKILDISSPKLITSYISNKYPSVSIWGIDKFKNEISIWNKIVGKRKKLKLEYGDCTELKYPSNFFDEIYSISVIEHVGDDKNDGDIKMMKEAYRVLKKDGRLYLTTIISNKSTTIFKDRNLYGSNSSKQEKVFFCRIYNYSQIVKKLIGSTSFKVIKEEICNYRFPIYENIVNKTMPYSALFGILNYIVAPFIVRTQSVKKRTPFRAEYFCILQK